MYTYKVRIDGERDGQRNECLLFGKQRNIFRSKRGQSMSNLKVIVNEYFCNRLLFDARFDYFYSQNRSEWIKSWWLQFLQMRDFIRKGRNIVYETLVWAMIVGIFSLTVYQEKENAHNCKGKRDKRKVNGRENKMNREWKWKEDEHRVWEMGMRRSKGARDRKCPTHLTHVNNNSGVAWKMFGSSKEINQSATPTQKHFVHFVFSGSSNRDRVR